ncbi:phenylalanyl-tRNA synthetase [Pseudovirgaria hyperparasitica]|uniref:Phenylalanine--tRNA ligase beta subunit n=1 Tax=Pseudovirgaria hyperparasitica TaxID=470096 RepID=A0A6A6W5N6_9PEZI|nr:phenylalanyl-tRNA synthetase [Pseudovirgaria hyperparasitica]KAF2757913.1 phenylalanyl-tRNA synthetase [Pseudovirgaria hyperparasitica]
MPTITVDKAELYESLGKEYTTKEFDELCFEFGIELDEDTSETGLAVVNGVEQPPQLKIEIPANRYDMLCFEGIAMNLKVFLEQQSPPNYTLTAPTSGELQVINVAKETETVRPLLSGAVLRNIKFTKARYESFISLQDKLHQNLARQRTLVSIGTHDLDTIKGPFSYEALAPGEIEFIPLNQEKKMNARELMEFYEKDKHLGRYLHIIKDKPLYPVIYDANRTVLSLPPIINGNHSKITLDTKNVLVEITAIDETKVEIINNILVAMFGPYCDAIEPIKIVSEHNKKSREVPDLTPRSMPAEVSYLNDVCGLDLSPAEQCRLLARMGHSAKPSTTSPNDTLDVNVPVTRADVLHQADIMEDLGIAYGFNKLPRFYPNKTAAVAAPLAINKLGDIVRMEAAMAGWSEVMPLILCSHDENFAWLNRIDDGNTAVRLQNPKTAEYQVVRTSLFPGLLKTIRENKHHSVPMKIFEVADVAFKDLSLERKSRNERHFAAAWYGKTSGFEVVHGLLDRIMLMLKSTFITREAELSHAQQQTGGQKADALEGFWIEEVEDKTFFHGHGAEIHLRLGGKEHVIGSFGILHPSVLKHYELPYPVSALEINLEVFL